MRLQNKVIRILFVDGHQHLCRKAQVFALLQTEIADQDNVPVNIPDPSLIRFRSRLHCKTQHPSSMAVRRTEVERMVPESDFGFVLVIRGVMDVYIHTASATLRRSRETITLSF